MLTIADKTANLRSLLISPPMGWTRGRCQEYFRWAAEVVGRCRGVNAQLEAAFDQAYRQGAEKLRFASEGER